MSLPEWWFEMNCVWCGEPVQKMSGEVRTWFHCDTGQIRCLGDTHASPTAVKYQSWDKVANWRDVSENSQMFDALESLWKAAGPFEGVVLRFNSVVECNRYFRLSPGWKEKWFR